LLAQDDQSYEVSDQMYQEDTGYQDPSCDMIQDINNAGFDPADLLQYSVKNELLGIYQCTLCSEFSHKSRSNVRNHIVSKHFPNSFSYPCHFCEKILPSNQALLKHKSVFHKNRSDLPY